MRVKNRTTVNDPAVESILHHVGIVDHSTVISVESSLLYPSIPSYPLFRPIPFDLQPDPSTYRHLLNLLTWNEYYYQQQYLHSQHRAAESIPFVSVPASLNPRRPAPFSSKATWAPARRLCSSTRCTPFACPASSSTATTSPCRVAVMPTWRCTTGSSAARSSPRAPC